MSVCVYKEDVSFLQASGVVVHNRYDPTHTTTLRNAFAADARRRFTELTRAIRKAVVEEDCFGLQVRTHQVSTPGYRAFAFSRSSDKLAAFEAWLDKQVEKGILDVRSLQQVGTGVEGAWTNRYIFDSYKRGVERARYELDKAGFNVPTVEQTGGINITLSAPFHIDRLGLMYTRTFSDMRGLTEQMKTQISRVLAQGLADGDNPRLLARKLVGTINGTKMGDLGLTDTIGRFIPAQRRATLIARTEIIRAHHAATIQEYKNWGVEGVVVKAEFMTAGDDRVCSICAGLQGDIYTLEEAEKLIPVHPQCRCICLPYMVRPRDLTALKTHGKIPIKRAA